MKHKWIPILICLISSLQVNGQVAEQMIKNFNKLSNITYQKSSSGINLMTSKKGFVDTSLTMMSRQPNGKWIFKEKTKTQEDLYDGSKWIELNPLESIYKISNAPFKSGFYYSSLAYIIDELTDDLKKGKPILRLPDTVIYRRSFYHIRVTQIDSIRNNKRIFSVVTLVIDKKSYLPYYYRKNGQGFIDGTDMYVTQLNEYSFFDYKINSNSFPDLSSTFIPANFTVERTKTAQNLLAKGTKAPEIDLTDYWGKRSKLSDFRDKVVLISFTVNGCPHCAKSIEPINRMVEKYGSSAFTVLNINLFDDMEAIHEYNQKYKVKYNSYKSGESTSKDYHVESYPNFYIVDKSGYISKSYLGFSNELEKDVSGIVDKLINGK